MPDSSDILQTRAPDDWAAAFARLPLEKPTMDMWPRVARRLDGTAARARSGRRERRTTWLIGTAGAAVLLVAVWTPLSRWRQSDPVTTPPSSAIASANGVPGTLGPAAPVAAMPRGVSGIGADDEASKAAPPMAVTDAGRSEDPDAIGKQHRTARTLPSARKVTTVAAPVAPPDEATPPVVRSTAPAEALAVASDGDAATPATPADATGVEQQLQQLQGRSAQLEALVALARDERVGSAGGELITGELDARIAAVDAALSQPDLMPARKQELWQERVELLQQLAGVESTARWLAAQGTLHDAALVSVD